MIKLFKLYDYIFINILLTFVNNIYFNYKINLIHVIQLNDSSIVYDFEM